MRPIHYLSSALACALATTLAAGCPKGKLPGKVPDKVPDVPKTTADKVDPNACGNYASNAPGKKVKAFLEATADLEMAILETQNYLRDSCQLMGTELSLVADPNADTATACGETAAALQDHIQISIDPKAEISVEFEPPRCEVNMDVAAEVAAACEGKAVSDIGVTCDGTCSGVCQGECDGECVGAAGTAETGGACDAECKGVCKGTCTGGCDGSADVDVGIECKAKATVKANIQAKCMPPDVEFKVDVGIIDTSKAEAAKRSIEKGLPQVLAAQKKLAKPIKSAYSAWLKATVEMSKALSTAPKTFGDQSLCVAAQLKAALALKADLQTSITIQVDASASVRSSAKAGTEQDIQKAQ